MTLLVLILKNTEKSNTIEFTMYNFEAQNNLEIDYYFVDKSIIFNKYMLYIKWIDTITTEFQISC